ncbi:transferase, partial [Salmonella enterica subsp. enterica serovar Eko]|nr:transferase [Salmonella enterica]EEP5376913.1 transferase [Salmonella enterica subsp. enterica serovar Eko]EEW9655867.1 transferase [Salmonella enterica subsp. enterica serovar Derby]EEP7128170.1 transferase [Salmonella enterica subsp. enterica serovar Eko]EHH2618324.1 transferase [Salmonella enterica subsp. enterica serovar Eko]
CYGNSDEKRDLSEFYAKLGCNKNMINTVLRFGKLAYAVKNITVLKNLTKRIIK